MIYSNFESLLEPEDIRKQNLDSLIRKNVKNILFAVMAINWYVLMISLVNLCLGEYAGYNFINKCCTDTMKKYFDKTVLSVGTVIMFMLRIMLK